MDAHASPAARAVEVTLASVAPASFDNNGWLYGWNLFLMTAAVGIGLLMIGLQVKLIARDRYAEQVKRSRLPSRTSGMPKPTLLGPKLQ